MVIGMAIKEPHCVQLTIPTMYLLVTRMYTGGGCTLHVNHCQHYMASLVLLSGHCVLNVSSHQELP